MATSRISTKGRCDCCPYGYHIDLDFMRFCESIVSGEASVEKLERLKIMSTSKRTQPSCFHNNLASQAISNVISKLEEIKTRRREVEMGRNNSPGQNEVGDISAFRELGFDLELEISAEEQEFLKELDSMHNSKPVGCSMSPYPEHSIRHKLDSLVSSNSSSLIMDSSFNSESFDKPNKCSSLINWPDKSEFGLQNSSSLTSLDVSLTNSTISSPTITTLSMESRSSSPAASSGSNQHASLLSIREQMASSLSRLRDLEQQLKAIPVLQVQLSVLKEEKRLLLQQLKVDGKHKIMHSVGVGQDKSEVDRLTLTNGHANCTASPSQSPVASNALRRIKSSSELINNFEQLVNFSPLVSRTERSRSSSLASDSTSHKLYRLTRDIGVGDHDVNIPVVPVSHLIHKYGHRSRRNSLSTRYDSSASLASSSMLSCDNSELSTSTEELQNVRHCLSLTTKPIVLETIKVQSLLYGKELQDRARLHRKFASCRNQENNSTNCTGSCKKESVNLSSISAMTADDSEPYHVHNRSDTDSSVVTLDKRLHTCVSSHYRNSSTSTHVTSKDKIVHAFPDVCDAFTSTESPAKSVCDGFTSTESSAKSVCDGFTSTESPVKSVCDAFTNTESQAKSVCDGFTSTESPAKSVCDAFTNTESPVKSVCDGFTSTESSAKSVCDGFTSTESPVKSVCDAFTNTESQAKSVCDGFTSTESPAKSVCDAFTNTESPVKSVCDGFTSTESPAKSVRDAFANTESPVKSVCDGFTNTESPAKSVSKATSCFDLKQKRDHQSLVDCSSQVSDINLSIRKLSIDKCVGDHCVVSSTGVSAKPVGVETGVWAVPLMVSRSVGSDSPSVSCVKCSKRPLKISIGTGNFSIYDSVKCLRCLKKKRSFGCGDDRSLKLVSVGVGSSSINDLLCDKCTMKKATVSTGSGLCSVNEFVCAKCSFGTMSASCTSDITSEISRSASSSIESHVTASQSEGFAKLACLNSEKMSHLEETEASSFRVFHDEHQVSTIKRQAEKATSYVKRIFHLDRTPSPHTASEGGNSTSGGTLPGTAPEKNDDDPKRHSFSSTSSSCGDASVSLDEVPPLKLATLIAPTYEASPELLLSCTMLKNHFEKGADLSAGEVQYHLNTVVDEWFVVSSQPCSDFRVIEQLISVVQSISIVVLSMIINKADDNGNTALHYCVSHGNYDAIDVLLNTGICDVNKRNRAGYTSLMLTALVEILDNTQCQVIRRLFQLGDVNAVASKAKQTALMLAVSHGRLESTRLLIEMGADLNAQDEDGSTALMCASEHDHLAIVQLLLTQPGINVHLADTDGTTALSVAMEAGHRDVGVLLYTRMNVSPVQSRKPFFRNGKTSPSPHRKMRTYESS